MCHVDSKPQNILSWSCLRFSLFIRFAMHDRASGLPCPSQRFIESFLIANRIIIVNVIEKFLMV